MHRWIACTTQQGRRARRAAHPLGVVGLGSRQVGGVPVDGRAQSRKQLPGRHGTLYGRHQAHLRPGARQQGHVRVRGRSQLASQLRSTLPVSRATAVPEPAPALCRHCTSLSLPQPWGAFLQQEQGPPGAAHVSHPDACRGYPSTARRGQGKPRRRLLVGDTSNALR